MARMRAAKAQLKTCLCKEDWRSDLAAIAEGGMTSIGPLFSFLLGDPLLMHRSAVALGATCALLAKNEREKARSVVRRYMWHLSEESGNIGWGIPEAFGETLAASKELAEEYHRILVTYVIDLHHSDNYCDNDVLRRSCYWACGRFAKAHFSLAQGYKPWLVRGLADRDPICRGMAAWALGHYPLTVMDAPPLQSLCDEQESAICLLFDGEKIIEKTVWEVASDCLRKIR